MLLKIMGGEYFYVKEGLTRFYGYQFTFMPTADLKALLYTTKILPILSDPTSEDGDGDGRKDSEDPFPLKGNIFYDREAVQEYALTWSSEIINGFFTEKYNYEYIFFTGKASDCANFVSQCVYAGGLKMNDEWRMKNVNGFISFFADKLPTGKDDYLWTRTWSLADNQFQFFSSYFSLKTASLISADYRKNDSLLNELISINNIQVGDVLYFMDSETDVAHASIITGVTENDIYYSAHSDPATNKSLSTVIKEKYYGIKILIINDVIE